MNKTEELCYDAMKNKTNYYEIANKYWDNVEPTVNGMLGGFEILTEPDVKDSSSFIQEFVTGNNPRLNTDLCCDCGAGIGRVSKNFLLKYFKKVDLVEQCSNFLETAKKEIFVGEYSNKVDQYINKGLQEFFPEKQRYDLIWNQWVLGHLTNDDLELYLIRCKGGLKKNGLIGVKENLTKNGIALDEEDSSVTRSDEIFKEIFAKAGLKIIKEKLQTNFPTNLYKVKMYLLEPI
ncbi:hypothetical protein HDU92_004055 [Lobulomyces angularis]|nr:hypothetical protein HDU92_004055 [Lobulomyces angularis]